MATSTAAIERNTPSRSLAQRMAALESANRVRGANAKTKRDVRAGTVAAVEVILEPTREAATLRVEDLLRSAPGLGRVKASKLLEICEISSRKRIGGLTSRQKRALVAALSRRIRPGTTHTH